MHIAVVSSSGVWKETKGGVGSYSKREDEIVSFGFLKDMMKLHSHNLQSMQDGSKVYRCMQGFPE